MVDLDVELENEYGKSIPEIFADEGEAAFRASERRHLKRALAGENVVISTGGGAPASDEVWSGELLGHPETLTITLDAARKRSMAVWPRNRFGKETSSPGRCWRATIPSGASNRSKHHVSASTIARPSPFRSTVSRPPMRQSPSARCSITTANQPRPCSSTRPRACPRSHRTRHSPFFG